MRKFGNRLAGQSCLGSLTRLQSELTRATVIWRLDWTRGYTSSHRAAKLLMVWCRSPWFFSIWASPQAAWVSPWNSRWLVSSRTNYIRERTKWYSFHNLDSEVTHCHFHHFLVFRSQSESSSHSEGGKLGSIFWSEVYQNTVWTCF